MATLFITCGLPGAGKTTLAKYRDAERSAVRLTADEWLHDLYPQLSGDELDRMRGPVERLQWRLATCLLELGCNVVLDWGLWAREERDRYRSQARALGARVVLCVLDPPREELLQRLGPRNLDGSRGAFYITEAALDRASTLFQRPTLDELALFDTDPDLPTVPVTRERPNRILNKQQVANCAGSDRCGHAGSG
jgi:predicted kinase